MQLFEKFVGNILKCGPVPKHIAVIMDGNRRYGKIYSVPSQRETYIMGLKSLELFYRMSVNIGVKELTVYAFSIENFNRSNEEVAVLLEDILPKTLSKILEDYEDGTVSEHNIRFKIIGKRSMFSRTLQDLILKVEEATAKYDQLLVNLALAYTSRDEISQAMRTVVKEVNDNILDRNDIDVEYIQKHLYCSDQVDCLVRTSGEVRFSDFLLWQIGKAHINIYETLWPEFGVMAFAKLIVDYQRAVLLKKKKVVLLETLGDHYGI